MKFSREFLDELKTNTDLKDLVEEYTELKKVKMSTKTKMKYAGFFFRKKLFFNLFMIVLLTVVTSFLAIIEVLGFIDLNEETVRINLEEGYDETYYYYNSYKNSEFEAVNTELIQMYWDVGKYLSKLCAEAGFGYASERH